MDELRQLLMREPRGHGAMSGAILQPPARDDADWGVIYIEVSGCLPMCGHGTIGVATVLVETGMVPVVEGETVIRLDVPAGLVEARVAVENGRARSVTIRNVASFLHQTDRVVDEVTVAGKPAIVPEITGRAWITGMGQYLLDAEDPFPAGFALG
jgi:proline racemase